VIKEDPDNSVLELARLRRENERLHQANVQLAESNKLFQAEREQLLEQLNEHNRTIDSLQHQLQALLRRYYGRSSEKVDPKQMMLFKDLLDKCIPEMPEREDSDSPEDEIAPGSRRKGHGRRRLPADLP